MSPSSTFQRSNLFARSIFLYLILACSLVNKVAASPTSFQQITRRAASSSSPASLNASLAAVCTPSECIQGANALTAGVSVITPVNGSSRSTVLLPGTYTATSALGINNSILAFGTNSQATSQPGFNSTGKIGATFSVTQQTGLTSYSIALYQGTPTFTGLSNSNSNSTQFSNSSSAKTTPSAGIGSFLISDSAWAVLKVGGDEGKRIIAWDSLADVSNLAGSPETIALQQIQSSGCTTPCASGGTCIGSTCVCAPGFAGATCDACAAGHFGKACIACPAGCTECDEGITASGRCLDRISSNSTLPSTCNCGNGICASASSDATCSCNAGWATAANGTQCAACASGYFMTSSGDCLACDPSCASCSGPTGICQTCQNSLQPDSADPTKCVAATAAGTNGTFITCPSRTFYDVTSSSCVDCNPLCETCFTAGTAGCLSCRTPNGLLQGKCVALNSRTGECDATSVRNGTTAGTTAAGWVFDNSKQSCDALPAGCTAGGIDNFGTTSTRADLNCSACIPGSALYQGKCVEACPDGTTVSADGKTCTACDSACGTCFGPTSSDCLSCSSASQLVLDGNCVAGPMCPAGYFITPGTTNSTSACLPCHPDCLTCGTTFDECLSCASDRPVLASNGKCFLTCGRTEYFDTAKGICVACDSSCSTCSGAASGACLSCSSTTILIRGNCVPTEANCSVVPGFGVCLAQLVTVAKNLTSSAEEKSYTLAWYYILVIVLCVLFVIFIGLYWFRKREQKRRLAHTNQFRNNLGKKEVELKLQAMDPKIAYPPLPSVNVPPYQNEVEHEIPLTPRFVLGDPPTPVESTHSIRNLNPRWSASSYGSKATQNPSTARLVPQATGVSGYSDTSYSNTSWDRTPQETSRNFTAANGTKITLGDRNPFR